MRRLFCYAPCWQARREYELHNYREVQVLYGFLMRADKGLGAGGWDEVERCWFYAESWEAIVEQLEAWAGLGEACVEQQEPGDAPAHGKSPSKSQVSEL